MNQENTPPKKQTEKSLILDFKEALEKKQITQYQLAKKTGMAQSNISRMLNDDGRAMPTLRTLLKLCEAAGLTIKFEDA